MKLTAEQIRKFQKKVLDHYKKNGRFFPWRTTTNPYYILVSEVMLQQTQADRVVKKYKLFIKKFHSFKALAKAPLADVLKAWQGLGYNRRAIQLKKTAEMVTAQYRGQLPNDPVILKTFPGIGPHTAGSICAFAFNMPVPFIETNIRAVYIQHFFSSSQVPPLVGEDKGGVNDNDLMPLIEQTLDSKNPRIWYNALMDYGVFLKKQFKNPSRKSAHYTKQRPFKGSNREIRGVILRALTHKSPLTSSQIIKTIDKEEARILKNLSNLKKEGFIIEKNNKWYVI